METPNNNKVETKESKVIDEKALPIPMLGRELGRLEGKTFYLAEHEFGVLYHVYNSMDLIVRPSQQTYETLVDLIRNQDFINSREGEERKMYEAYVSAIIYNLKAPMLAFCDSEFMFASATNIIDLLVKLQKRAEEAELQEETPKENEEFKQAILGLHTLKDLTEAHQE